MNRKNKALVEMLDFVNETLENLLFAIEPVLAEDEVIKYKFSLSQIRAVKEYLSYDKNRSIRM